MINTGPIYERGLNLFGQLMGDGNRALLRPNYASTTSAEAPVRTSFKMRVDRGGASEAEPPIAGGTYYVICPSLRSIVLAGDVITKAGCPTVTVQNIASIKACVAIQMIETGKLTTAKDRDLFTGVRFDYLSPPTVISGLDESMEDSVDFGTQRIVLWKRAGIRKGMRLIDTTNDKVWFIEQVIPKGNLLVIQATERAA